MRSALARAENSVFLTVLGVAAMQYGPRTRAGSVLRCVLVWLVVGNGYFRLLMMAIHASNERVPSCVRLAR